MDLTGKQFGSLTVLHRSEERLSGKVAWLCECNKCGKKRLATSRGLNIGQTKCDCTPNIHTKHDIRGQRFGNLVAREYIGKSTWLCDCDCGGTTKASYNDLKSGKRKSCGKCTTQVKDITGQKFGKLTAIELAYIVDNRAYWKCRCDCDGNISTHNGKDLRMGKIISCGCSKIDSAQERVKDLIGMEFGSLIVTERSGSTEEGRAIWKCTCICGNTCEVTGHSLLNGNTQSCGHGCIRITGSRNEIEIKEYIQSLTDTEITKPKMLDIGDGGRNKEIDIFMESKNLGIEYNGSVYHASKGAVYSNKPKLYHRDKFLAAKEQGIHLISIFDVDWNTNADKIKMYLKSLLVDNKKIFARKCEIKSVDRKIANEFTDKYHLQGHARLSSINYGLYYNDELLSVMSFGRLRLQKTEEGQFELHRYCVKDGYTIVGGANKLLKAFEREHNPKYLLSFSDNDYFMGGIYDKLGFTNDGQSTPRYYWFYHTEEIKREKCQLKHLKEKCPELLQEAYDNEASNKEDYVMLKLGACKVYRSGNTRWINNYVS